MSTPSERQLIAELDRRVTEVENRVERQMGLIQSLQGMFHTSAHIMGRLVEHTMPQLGPAPDCTLCGRPVADPPGSTLFGDGNG